MQAACLGVHCVCVCVHVVCVVCWGAADVGPLSHTLRYIVKLGQNKEVKIQHLASFVSFERDEMESKLSRQIDEFVQLFFSIVM